MTDAELLKATKLIAEGGGILRASSEKETKERKVIIRAQLDKLAEVVLTLGNLATGAG